jgi:hypothetical protein
VKRSRKGRRGGDCTPLFRICFVLLVLLLLTLPVFAQEATPEAEITYHSWELFLQRGADGAPDTLLFVDILTGSETSVIITGERYTPTSAGVLYFDYVGQRVMLAQSDGTVRLHPFIALDAGARRVDWIVSRDGRSVAWTQTYGTPNALTTVTTVASADGANAREILQDGPRDGIRALPVGFNTDNTLLYMDAQPDGLGRFTAYTQYAGLFSVDLATGEPRTLPGEPACFCGGGLRAGRFLRLTLTGDLSGFDVQLYDLTRGTHQTIPALRLTNYTQAGDVLIAPDGTLAVYALSRVQNFGTPTQSVETVFILVDLQAMIQTTLTEPITTYIHPVRWTEDNTAILFTSPQQSGTWKVELSDKKLLKVAEATYIGAVRD